MKSASRTWRKMFLSAGTTKWADPSASTGTTPCWTFRPRWAFLEMAACCWS